MSVACSRCTATIRSNSYKIQCINCKLWYHRDCANLTIEELQLYTRDINAENTKKWYCDSCKEFVPALEKREIKDNTISKETEAVIQENNFLKRLVKELEEKNVLLKQNNSLLEQNKSLLEQKVQDLEMRLVGDNKNTNSKKRHLTGTQYTGDGMTRSLGSTTQMGQLELLQNENNSKTPTQNVAITPSYRQALLRNQTNQMNTPESQGFKKQINRRKQIYVGTAEAGDSETEFSGKENKNKKAWLFISRVKDHVTEDQIKEYVKRKTEITEDQEVVVKRIKTKYDSTRKDCQCFQVGIRYDLKDKMYENNFWPQKVAFRRFDFNVIRRTEHSTEVF